MKIFFFCYLDVNKRYQFCLWLKLVTATAANFEFDIAGANNTIMMTDGDGTLT